MDRIAEIWLMESYWIFTVAIATVIGILAFVVRQYIVTAIAVAVVAVCSYRLLVYEHEVGDMIRQNLKERKL